MDESDSGRISEMRQQYENNSNASRRNLDEIGASGIMGLSQKYNVSDIWVLAPTGIAVWLAAVALPSGYYWGIGKLALALILTSATLLGIYLSPPSMGPYKWVRYVWEFRRGDFERSATRRDSGRITDDRMSSNGDRGGLEDLTRIDGFAPDSDGMWRFDGTIIGGIEIDPAELSLASDEGWESAANELGSIINSLDHAGQLRSGSVRIDTEDIKRRCQDRLGDDDVRNNAKLRENVSMYKQQLPKQMDGKNASIRTFQFITPVTMKEVQMQGRRLMSNLSDLPVIGFFVDWLAGSKDLTVREIRYRQERILKERRKAVADDLSGITGCDASELSINELIDVFESSWTGERVDHDGNRDNRSIPVVTMERDHTDSGGDLRPPETMDNDELNQQLVDNIQNASPDNGDDSESHPTEANNWNSGHLDQKRVTPDDVDESDDETDVPEPETPETPETPDDTADDPEREHAFDGGKETCEDVDDDDGDGDEDDVSDAVASVREREYPDGHEEQAAADLVRAMENSAETSDADTNEVTNE